MKILYVGADDGTSRHRRDALIGLGHRVVTFDPYRSFSRLKPITWWGFHTGYVGISILVADRLRRFLEAHGTFDFAFVDNGETLNPSALRIIKNRCGAVINFNQDNPYSGRDGGRWRQFLKSLPSYDLVVVPRSSNLKAAHAHGARQVFVTSFAADRLIHRPPFDIGDEAGKKYDVVFVGTFMEKRGAFLHNLIAKGVPLSIYGANWHKAPEWRALKPYVLGPSLDDFKYPRAIYQAKIALALLSKGNQDLHTTRSFEIPSIGTLMCAERTAEHLGYYHEEEEAVFWSDVEECADKCLTLLKEPARVSAIAKAGYIRAISNNRFNDIVMKEVLNYFGTMRSDQPARFFP